MTIDQPAKHIYIPTRHPRLSREEFAARWRQHAETGATIDVSEIAGLRYCLTHDPAGILPSATDEHDGVGLLPLRGLASIPTADAVLVQNETAFADELRTFARPVQEMSCYTASEILIPGQETGVAVFDLARRRAGVPPTAALRSADQSRQADLADSRLLDHGLRRWVRNVLVAPAPRGYRYDTIDELWFDSLDAVAAASGALEFFFERSGAVSDRRSSATLVTTVIHRVGRDRP